MKPTLSKLFNSLPDTNSLTKSSLISSKLIITKKTHAQILKSGSPIEQSQLIRSYCHLNAFPLARQMFDECPNWDLFSTTAIISSFSLQNRHLDAISLFSLMLQRNIRPNQFTFGTVLRSSTALHDLAVGKQLHACLMKMGLQSDVFAGSSVLHHYAKFSTAEEAQRAFDDIHEPNPISYTALLSGYLKNNQFDEALRLFCQMPDRTVVSWNAMISGCSQIGLNEESVNFFVEMCLNGVMPNNTSFAGVLSAAANLSSLGIGRSFHAYIVKVLNELEVYVGNSLLSFYAKCGCLEDGIVIFEGLEERNIVSWNAVICGYAQNGRGEEAVEFFKKLKLTGLKPNDITLLGLLFGCNHSGLVDEGYAYFKQLRDEDPSTIRPEHYACVVDLLSRSGRFSEAEDFLKELPFEPKIGFWKSILGGCKNYLNHELAIGVAQRILMLDPNDTSFFVQLSNMHSSFGKWKNVLRIRSEMQEKRMKKVPGCSWIEVQGKIHVFFNGDIRHPQAIDIYSILIVMP